MTPFVILHKANDDNGGAVFIDPRRVYGIVDVHSGNLLNVQGGSIISLDIGGKIDRIDVKETASEAAAAIQEVLLAYEQNERLHKFDSPCYFKGIDPCFDCPSKPNHRLDITCSSDASKV